MRQGGEHRDLREILVAAESFHDGGVGESSPRMVLVVAVVVAVGPGEFRLLLVGDGVDLIEAERQRAAGGPLRGLASPRCPW
jgi:hypothetical protein